MGAELARVSWTSRVGNALVSGYEPAPAQFLTRRAYYPWIVIGTTCISGFIGQLDASIVQFVLPALEREFNASLSAATWVAIAYLLAYASFLPIFARLSEILGRKLMYLAGYGLFTLATLACGFASDLTLLIGLRALQGIGGALLGANSISILVKAAGESRRARGMGLFAGAQAVGVSAGPAVGGLLLGALGWQWVFWAAVPFGLAGVAIGWFVLPQTVDFDSDRRFDWRGALLLTPALTALIIVLSEIHAWGLISPALITGVVAAVVLISSFIWQERKAPAPLIDLQLFRLPAFSCGIISVILSYALLYGMFFLMSFALIRGYHDSPQVAGLRLSVIPVALGIMAPISGALYERLGPRVLTVSGMIICVAALALLSDMLTGDASAAGVTIALTAFGIGLGAFIAPNNNSTVGAAPADRAGEAGGLLNLTRVFGTTIGVATGSSVLSWRLEVLSGIHDHTLTASSQDLLQAVRDVLLVLAVFAIVAGATSLVRSHSRPGTAGASALRRIAGGR